MEGVGVRAASEQISSSRFSDRWTKAAWRGLASTIGLHPSTRKVQELDRVRHLQPAEKGRTGAAQAVNAWPGGHSVEPASSKNQLHSQLHNPRARNRVDAAESRRVVGRVWISEVCVIEGVEHFPAEFDSG